ncbi:hypothetical protein O2W14_17475 [Modestobacter sp. VKM Ac-2986]|uniref:hypothetical protein n=1 Tax=Modestobacter sp. VKM Ac-2986 TaxID=3004140 RepID=UPI0022AB83E8|nr:hypothetical protein [Modestobacter sp. VKM Ac-2986]MCZ2830631.1 hypothetical protein [Modestobacter sp. VKM Ac-2986]
MGEPVEGEVIGGGTGPGDGLGAAGRALADAVAGLLGRDDKAGPAGARRPSAGARAAGSVLTEVISALAGAARSDDTGSSRSGAGRPGPSFDPKGGAKGAGIGPGGLLSDLLDAAAPRLPIRDAARLRAAHPGASDGEIADVLVARAARLTAGVGAATGGLAAAQWFAPPTLVAVPLELGAQTVLVAAVEVVLVGELHELAGRPAPGDARARAGAYLASWTTQRAVGTTGPGGLLSMLGTAGASAVRRRLTRRMARSTTSMAPLLVGASLAARSNRKATVTLADRLRADLRLPPAAKP